LNRFRNDFHLKSLVLTKKMSLICQYCTKTYCNKSSLIHHQKTAKKCLRVQNKEVTICFTCDGCSNTFTRKDTYQIHLTNCARYIEIQLSEEYEGQLIEKDEEIELLNEEVQQHKDENASLREQIAELQKRPTNITVNNNQVYNQTVQFYVDKMERRYYDRVIHKEVKSLTFSDLKSPTNFADWTAAKLTNIVFCTDRSRKNFIFKDEMDKVVRDPRFRAGLQILCNSISERAQKLLRPVLEKLQEGASKFNDPAIQELNGMLNMIISIADGRKPSTNALTTYLSRLSTQLYVPMLPN